MWCSCLSVNALNLRNWSEPSYECVVERFGLYTRKAEKQDFALACVSEARGFGQAFALSYFLNWASL